MSCVKFLALFAVVDVAGALSGGGDDEDVAGGVAGEFDGGGVEDVAGGAVGPCVWCGLGDDDEVGVLGGG